LDATGWTALVNVAAGPSAREDHTWTVIDDVAYLFGGRTADGPANDLWAFNLTTNEWHELHPSGTTPEPRFGHTATAVPGVGLVIWSGQGDRFFDDIWAYDPAVDAWHQLPSFGAVPDARYGSCASLGPDGRLWISHGFTQDDGRFDDTRAYDFATGEWTDETPSGERPVKRCLHDCYWSDAGQLILYGGQTTGVLALGDIWSYDPQAQAWAQGPETSAAPRQLYAIAAGGPPNQMGSDAIVFGGGSVDRGYLSDLVQISSESLTVISDQVPDGPPARSGATLTRAPGWGEFLLFGGKNADGLLRDIWRLDGYWLGP
jgi:N-acetylneuraminic acid mutarotase